MTNYYRVLSLNLAAWLKMNGFSIMRTAKENDGTAFYFTKNDELFNCITKYNQNIELKKFISTYRDIKNVTKAMK